MPNTSSAAKRQRQNITRRIRNRVVKTRVRGAVRKLREAIDRKAVKEAESQLNVATSQLDGAVRKGVLHRNTAARYKARLAAGMSRMHGDPAAAATAPTKPQEAAGAATAETSEA